MSEAKGAIRSAGWAVGGGYASQILAFVLFIAVSRIVGPEAFGAVAIAIALVDLCRAITMDNVATTLVAKPGFDEEAFNAGLALTMGSALLLCAALALGAPALAILFNVPALASVLPQIALILLLHGACRLQEARLVQQMQFRALAVRSIVAVLIGGGVGLWAAHQGMGVQALIYQQWAAAIVASLLLWVASDWRPRFLFRAEAFFALQRASMTLAPAALLSNISQLADTLAASFFGGPYAAGVYNLGKRVRVAMQVSLSGALGRISLPTFARLNTEPGQLARALQSALRITALIALPVFFGIAAVSPELVDVFLGAAWKPAAAPMALLLIGGALTLGAAYCENALLVLEQRKVLIAIRLFVLLTLGAGLLLFARLGPTAIAACVLAAAIAHVGAAAWGAARFAGLRPAASTEAVIWPLLVSTAMLAFVWLLRIETAMLEPATRLAILIVAGATLYTAGAWLFARPTILAAYRAARAAL